MKKFLFLLLLTLGCAAGAFAQSEEQDISRNRSKYANDQFREDDQYTVAEPYQTVTVSQPRSKRIKNIIFMIGAVVGVILYLSKNEERHYLGLYIILIAMCFKIAESSMRMIK